MPRNGAMDSLIFYETLPPTCNFVRLKNKLVGWVCTKKFAGARCPSDCQRALEVERTFTPSS